MRNIKSKVKTIGKVAKSGNWIRNSSSGISGSRINKLSVNYWVSSKSANGKIEYNYQSNSEDYMSMFHSPNLKNWELITLINGYQDKVRYSGKNNSLQVNHSGLVYESTGKISPKGDWIKFYK
tara:strand:- start:55 stop:423 length:369 start_codon:yes stop_codon:yes gene_type:complete